MEQLEVISLLFVIKYKPQETIGEKFYRSNPTNRREEHVVSKSHGNKRNLHNTSGFAALSCIAKQ